MILKKIYLLIILIKDWININSNKEFPSSYFITENAGICIIRKFIPNQENPKFLKLSRPGFVYDEQEHDFIDEKFYDLNTNNWFNSNRRKKDEL